MTVSPAPVSSDNVEAIASKASGAASAPFLQSLLERRSFYQINDEVVVPDETVEDIVKFAVKHAPSSYNNQSSRVVVVFGPDHHKFWDTCSEALEAIQPADRFVVTKAKLDGFRAGRGTILFFEDNATIREFQGLFKASHDLFPYWANQASAMIQLICWTALEKEGYGCTLQHHNLMEQKAQSMFSLPESWQLIAQMPFGKPVAPAKPKTFKPLEDRVKVFGKGQ